MVGLIISMLFSRFWWRDTRMQELLAKNPNTISDFVWATAQPNGEGATISSTAFPYPMTFVPTPHHPDMSLPNLLSVIIPMARSPRTISIIPRRPSLSSNIEGEMEVDAQSIVGTGGGEVQRIEVQVQSEGLLLYFGQARYEPGTSPLSTWVPIQFEGVAVLDLFERCVPRYFSCCVSTS
jgi:snurportin-1